MSTADTLQAKTLLEAVRASLAHAGRFNPGDVVAPAAVLWTDADGQWRPVVEQLRGLMPEPPAPDAEAQTAAEAVVARLAEIKRRFAICKACEHARDDGFACVLHAGCCFGRFRSDLANACPAGRW